MSGILQNNWICCQDHEVKEEWGATPGWRRLRNMTDSRLDSVAIKEFIRTISKTEMGSES